MSSKTDIAPRRLPTLRRLLIEVSVLVTVGVLLGIFIVELAAVSVDGFREVIDRQATQVVRDLNASGHAYRSRGGGLPFLMALFAALAMFIYGPIVTLLIMEPMLGRPLELDDLLPKSIPAFLHALPFYLLIPVGWFAQVVGIFVAVRYF